MAGDEGDKAYVCAVAVMAKAPQAGKVKTRLVPPLTPEEATSLNAAFLRDVTENISLAGASVPLAAFVAYAPAGAAAAFDGLLAPKTGLVLADGSITAPDAIEGIGRSLLHATTSLLAQGFHAACLVNSDSPTLPTEFLCDAVTTLLRPGDRMVLGVAEDGGYYLIGLKSPHAALFANIAWSTDRVAAQTLERARLMGLEVIELPTWLDVDDAGDLARLVEALAVDGTVPGAYAAPATRAWVERVGEAALRR
jgi:hypothetical protein